MFNLEDFLLKGLRETVKNAISKSVLTGGTTKIIVDKVTATPEDLLGHTTWTNIINWSNYILTPIALLLVGIFVAIELYQLISKTNGNTDLEDITRFSVRIIIPMFIATNAVSFVTNIMNMMNGTIKLLADKIVNTNITSPGYEDVLAKVDQMHLGELLETWTIHSLLGAISNLFIPLILFSVVYGRLFEICFLLFSSPIPMASFLNSEWGSVGKYYLKYFVAIMLQGLLIVLACGISEALFTSSLIEVGTFSVAISWLVLCFVLSRTGKMAQKIVGV